jgi:hypothetical protein
MSIRETLNKRPKLTASIAGAVVMALLAVVYAQSKPRQITIQYADHLFFSDDDGKTFYTDDASNIAPYDHNGKRAVQAMVFHCDDGAPFVGYLVKYSPATKSALESYSAHERITDMRALAMRQQAMLVKKPGGSRWVPMHPDAATPDTELTSVLSVLPPPGATGDPVAVSPD